MHIDWIRGLLALIPYFLFLFLGIVVDIVLFRRYQRRKAIDDNIRRYNVRTSAHIVRRHAGILTKNIVYTYEYGGKLYGQVQYVTPQDFNDLNEGDTIAVCYLSNSPREAVLAEIDAQYLDYQLASVLFLLIIIYLFALILSTIFAIFLPYVF